MVDLSTYPYPSYEPSKPAAGVLAALVGISLLAWLVQSIQSKFQPVRLNVLLLISHLTIFIQLILRPALPASTRNSRAAFTATTVLLAVGFRLVILANFDFLIRVLGEKQKLSRAIRLGTFLCAIVSAILMIPAGALSYDASKIDASFRLRQASVAIILFLAVLFYPVWFLTKREKDANGTGSDMTKQGIALLIISSLCCLAVAIFLVVTSTPDNYVATSEQELWFYIFQLTPNIIALFTWSILHPARSLLIND